MARQDAKGRTTTPPLPRLKGKPAKGGSMFRTILILAALGGLGYAAATVPIHGRTALQRAYDAFPYEIVRKTPTPPPEPPKKRAGPAALKTPSEKISQADRDALDRLIPH